MLTWEAVLILGRQPKKVHNVSDKHASALDQYLCSCSIGCLCTCALISIAPITKTCALISCPPDHQNMQTIVLLHTGEVLLTAALDGGDNMSRNGTPLTNLARPSSFRRSFTRSSSLSNATQLALLGPEDSFDEVCGLPTVEEDSRCLVAAVLVACVPVKLVLFTCYKAFFDNGNKECPRTRMRYLHAVPAKCFLLCCHDKLHIHIHCVRVAVFTYLCCESWPPGGRSSAL